MTPQQINLIRSSFAAVYFGRDESARVFYERLFAIAPEMRSLFKGDLESQGRKLMDTLALAVTSLSHPQSLYHLVYDTAKRHAVYGATAKQYERVGAALLWMFDKQLGSDFTPEVEMAWAELYGIIADTMLRIGQETAD